MSESEPRNFLQACLLLLLRERPAHGYDLVRRLPGLRDGAKDGGRVYRALRDLEHEGLIESSWQTSEVGPPRRMYSITYKGTLELARQTDELTGTRDELHAFLERYARTCEAEVTC